MDEVFGFLNLYLSLPLTVLGFVATLIGLKIAFDQLIRTRDAATAATEAAIAATDALSRNLTTAVVHQLIHIEREMDRAIREGHRAVLLDYVSQWRFQAGQLHHFISQHKGEEKLATALMTSITVCGRPKAEINRASSDLIEVMRPTQNAVNKVSAQLGRLLADRTITNDT